MLSDAEREVCEARHVRAVTLAEILLDLEYQAERRNRR